MGFLGESESFENIISYYTNRFKEVCYAGFGMNGLWGASPNDVRTYFDEKGISYVGSFFIPVLQETVQTQGRGVLIISFWNRPMTDGIHTIAINYDGHNYTGYNYYTNTSTPQPYTSINEFLADDWRFVYGFYIPYS